MFFWYTHTNRFAVAHYEIPELGIQGDFKDAMRRVIPIVYRFNKSFRKEIDEYKEKINLPDHYVSMHIRGGDKQEETDLFPPQAYVDAANQKTSLRTAFVFTDDYSLFKKVKDENPSWTFFTLATEQEQGYHNDVFRRMGQKMRPDLVKMFASMEMVLSSDLFVGTYISNPAMFAGMLMADEQMVGLDYPRWLLL